LSPERVWIAKLFKTHIDRAVEELGGGCEVTLQGRFDKTPIRLEIDVTSKKRNTLTISDDPLLSDTIRFFLWLIASLCVVILFG
jgi:hypothetical protein